jgi:WD40 repeat protein
MHNVAISPDGRWIAGGVTTCRIWNADEGSVRCTYLDEGTAYRGGWNPERAVWESREHEGSNSTKAHTLRSVAISPDGRLLAASSDDAIIRLFETETGRLVGELKGHDAKVKTVLFHPDGTSLVSGGADGRILLWNHSSEHLIQQINEEPLYKAGREVTALAASPDGSWLAAGHSDGILAIWHSGDAAPIIAQKGRTQARHFMAIHALVMSGNGEWLAAGSGDGTIRIYETRSGRILRRHRIDERFERKVGGRWWERKRTYAKTRIRAMALRETDDHAIFAVASDDRRVRVFSALVNLKPWTWNRMLQTGRYGSDVNGVAFSPDGSSIAIGSGGFDNTVEILPLVTGHSTRILGHRMQTGPSMGFLPDERMHVVHAEGRSVLKVNAEEQQREPWVWYKANIAVDACLDATCIAVSPKGDQVAVGWANGHWEVRAPDSAELILSGNHPEPVTTLTWSATGDQLGFGFADGHVANLHGDVVTMRSNAGVWLRRADSAISGLVIPADGRWMACSTFTGTVQIVELDADVILRSFKRLDSPTSAMVGASDGSWLAVAAGNRIRILDPLTGRLRKTLSGHKDVISALAMSHDAQRLASASHDGTVRFWDTSTWRGRVGVRVGQPVLDVAFSPDDANVATRTADSTLEFWDVSSGKYHGFDWKYYLGPGIDTIYVHFSGCADEGGIDEITYAGGTPTNEVDDSDFYDLLPWGFEVGRGSRGIISIDCVDGTASRGKHRSAGR